VISTLNSPTLASLQFDDTLFNALVFNWNDLMPEAAAGQIQVEYQVGPAGGVEFVKVWGATIRGHWDLLCEHFMRSGTSNQSGLRFANGRNSDIFRGMLDSLMHHQELFLVEAAAGSDRMIQVSPPTDKERVSARKIMDALRDRLTS
jgi:hypothetical protein